MATRVSLEITLSPKWWLRPALVAAMAALRLGLIRDKASAEHHDGIITAEERASKWLANYAFTYEVR